MPKSTSGLEEAALGSAPLVLSKVEEESRMERQQQEGSGLGLEQVFPQKLQIHCPAVHEHPAQVKELGGARYTVTGKRAMPDVTGR